CSAMLTRSARTHTGRGHHGMKLSYLHPFLIAIAPILFLCAHNSDQVELTLVLIACGLSLALTGVLFAVAGLLMRNRHRAALAVSLFMILFFLFGHWFNIVWSWRIFRQSQHVEWVVLGASVIVLVG